MEEKAFRRKIEEKMKTQTQLVNAIEDLHVEERKRRFLVFWVILAVVALGGVVYATKSALHHVIAPLSGKVIAALSVVFKENPGEAIKAFVDDLAMAMEDGWYRVTNRRKNWEEIQEDRRRQREEAKAKRKAGESDARANSAVAIPLPRNRNYEEYKNDPSGTSSSVSEWKRWMQEWTKPSQHDLTAYLPPPPQKAFHWLKILDLGGQRQPANLAPNATLFREASVRDAKRVSVPVERGGPPPVPAMYKGVQAPPVGRVE